MLRKYQKSVRSIWLAIALLSLISPGAVSAKGLKNCAIFKSKYSNVIARSQADKTRYTSTDSLTAQVAGSIAVKPVIYRQNSNLDFDRDGLLCEEDLEMAVGFARAAEVLDGMLGGNKSSSGSLNGWGSCAFRGKNMWGSVYVSNSRFSADFAVYQTKSNFSSDLKVYLTSSSFSASSCGNWYITNSKFNADFTIYITDSEFSADFSIYLTSSQFSAGRN